MKFQLAISALVLTIGFVQVGEAHKTVTRQVAQEELASLTLTDSVKKLREDDEGVVVLFEKSKGSYYLRRDLQGFDGFKKKLDESLKSKAPKRVPVTVSYDSKQLNILEVK